MTGRLTICDSALEAVACIADGATVLVGGFGSAGQPVTLVEALLEGGASELTVVSNNAGGGDEGLAALIRDGRDGIGFAGMPVGQIAGHGHLEGAQDADVQMAAAHHRERVGVMKVGRAWQLGHRHLARVDQVGIDVVAVRLGTHAEHAVLGVQHDTTARRKVVGDPGRQADAEVDERAVRDVRRDDARQRVPVDAGQRAHHLPPDIARLRSTRTTRSTCRHGVTTCSGSS